MWIKRSKYELLEEKSALHDTLECQCDILRKENLQLQIDHGALIKEIDRLKDIINAQTEECKVGPWCKECIHRGEDKAYPGLTIGDVSCGFYRFRPELGHIFFCKKHLHELCPEFEGAVGSKAEGE